MKKKYIVTAMALGIILANQSIRAQSETVSEMEKASASGEEVAGPIGAAVGGFFGGAVGLVKDTGNTISGTTSTEEMYMDNDSDLETVAPRTETAKEMKKAATSGEEVAGPLGAAAGTLVGAGVGLVKDTGEVIAGKEYGEPVDEEQITYENIEEESIQPDSE
jgi:hypothetical protein